MLLLHNEGNQNYKDYLIYNKILQVKKIITFWFISLFFKILSIFSNHLQQQQIVIDECTKLVKQAERWVVTGIVNMVNFLLADGLWFSKPGKMRIPNLICKMFYGIQTIITLLHGGLFTIIIYN